MMLQTTETILNGLHTLLIKENKVYIRTYCDFFQKDQLLYSFNGPIGDENTIVETKTIKFDIVVP